MTDQQASHRPDHSAIITGGGSGIGLACAARFAAAGAAVVLVGRNEARLQDGVRAIASAVPGSTALWIAGDIADEDTSVLAVAAAEKVAPLRVGLANAGGGTLAPVIATSLEAWQQVLDTNLTGAFLTFKHAGAAIARAGGGALCAISSIAGLRTHRFMGAYCVSKAGLDMLVRNTADELGQAGVRVNSVCPGLVETDLARGLLDTDVVYEDYLDCMPIRRNGTTDDIANAVAFLCSEGANWITGVSLPVDGGHHLRRGPNVEVFSRALHGDDLTEGRT